MPADLRDLLHTKGRSMRSLLGLSRAVTVSRIARGAVRARPNSCQAIAKALGVNVEEVVAACDESWSRAHPAAPVGPVADGQEGASVSADVHAADPAQAGRA